MEKEAPRTLSSEKVDFGGVNMRGRASNLALSRLARPAFGPSRKWEVTPTLRVSPEQPFIVSMEETDGDEKGGNVLRARLIRGRFESARRRVGVRQGFEPYARV